MNKSVICLFGPTATGKTDCALALASHLPLEIISVDSAMVYRGMNIGTAKPTLKQRQEVAHHLIDICEPDQPYSAGKFCADAKELIADISARGKLPLLVGGTMLYFNALQQGIASLPLANVSLRQQLTTRAQQDGWPALHNELLAYDPHAAKRIHPNDAQRIQRALEVYYLTGQPLSTWLTQRCLLTQEYNVINLALVPEDRALLRQRIEMRLEGMLALGLIEEVQQLQARYNLNADTPSLRAVGYRQVWEYLQQHYDYPTLQQRIFTGTCQLAKRQLTWLNKWPDKQLFLCESPNLISQLTKAILAHLK